MRLIYGIFPEDKFKVNYKTKFSCSCWIKGTSVRLRYGRSTMSAQRWALFVDDELNSFFYKAPITEYFKDPLQPTDEEFILFLMDHPDLDDYNLKNWR